MILETGAIASHFTLLGIDGREYSHPRDTAGAPALLVFFKTTCVTCDLTLPYINRLRWEYPDGWALWAIAQDPVDKATEYARRFGIDYPVLIDAPGYEASLLYDPPATPTVFVLEPNGRVAYSTHGFAKDDLNDISSRIARCVGAEPLVIAPAEDGNPRFKPG